MTTANVNEFTAAKIMRQIIVDGFVVTPAIRIQMVDFYDKLIKEGIQTKMVDLTPHGFPNRFVTIEMFTEWADLANRGLKIPVIKAIRAETGVGIAEGKRAAESMFLFL